MLVAGKVLKWSNARSGNRWRPSDSCGPRLLCCFRSSRISHVKGNEWQTERSTQLKCRLLYVSNLLNDNRKQAGVTWPLVVVVVYIGDPNSSCAHLYSVTGNHDNDNNWLCREVNSCRASIASLSRSKFGLGMRVVDWRHFGLARSLGVAASLTVIDAAEFLSMSFSIWPGNR